MMYKAVIHYSGGRFHVKIQTEPGSAQMWSGWIKTIHEVTNLMREWEIPLERIEGLSPRA